MAVLSLQQITPAGTAPTYAAASAGGDRFPIGDNNFLHVKNGSGASITATVDSKKNCNQGFDHDLVVAIPAGTDKMIGPLGERFRDTDGLGGVSWSASASVTVAVVTH